MNSSRSSLNVKVDSKVLPQIVAYGETADGVALQLRSDPAGVLEVPELQNVLVAIHVGPSARISCRRGGESHSGSAVHQDIDINPAHPSDRWESHNHDVTPITLSLASSLRNTAATE